MDDCHIPLNVYTIGIVWFINGLVFPSDNGLALYEATPQFRSFIIYGRSYRMCKHSLTGGFTLLSFGPI